MPFSGKQMLVIVGLSAVTSFFVVPMVAKWFAPADAEPKATGEKL